MLSGYRTYIAAGFAGVFAILQAVGIMETEDAQGLINAAEAAALIFLRIGMKTTK